MNIPDPIYRRRRSVNSILKDSAIGRNFVDIVQNIYELIKVLEEARIYLSLNEFMLLLKDNIYQDIRFTYYDAFKSNTLKNSYNPYHGKSYSDYCNYYLFFLNYAHYYFNRIFKNPENEIDKKIVSYESSRNIKKQIDMFIELIDKDEFI